MQQLFISRNSSYFKIVTIQNNRFKIGYIDFNFNLNASLSLMELLGGIGNFEHVGNTKGGTKELKYKQFSSMEEVMGFFGIYNIQLIQY
jgi:hypothetical protein